MAQFAAYTIRGLSFPSYKRPYRIHNNSGDPFRFSSRYVNQQSEPRFLAAVSFPMHINAYIYSLLANTGVPGHIDYFFVAGYAVRGLLINSVKKCTRNSAMAEQMAQRCAIRSKEIIQNVGAVSRSSYSAKRFSKEPSLFKRRSQIRLLSGDVDFDRTSVIATSRPLTKIRSFAFTS